MERPIFNPLFLDREKAPPPPPSVLKRAWGLVQKAVRLLVTDMRLTRGGIRVCMEDEPLLTKVLRQVVYRLLFLPVLLVLAASALVYLGTHPRRPASTLDPLSFGHYYDPVNFVSDDGLRLEGWLVPLLDARRVLAHKEGALLQKHPAVVLVHDQAHDRSQMLPLVRPLHEAGYVVLVLGLRGMPNGSTFGLREADDVLGAVQMLRRRKEIHPDRIAILGVGTGANAAFLACRRDPGIAALVLDHPVTNVDELLRTHLSPRQPSLQWLYPLCKWTFELAYEVNSDDLRPDRPWRVVPPRPVLLFDAANGPSTTFRALGLQQTHDFLAKHVQATSPNLASTAP